MATIRENSRAIRKNDYGLENALAKLVRNRWADKCIAYVAHEWDLSDSEAAKVVYANASKAVLNKLLHHKRGGLGLFIELACDVTNTKLSAYIAAQAEEARRDHIKSEANRRLWEDAEARVAERDRLARVHSNPNRISGRENAHLGGEQDGRPVADEPRSFDGGRGR